MTLGPHLLEAFRYFLASLAALAVDTGLLLGLRAGLDLPVWLAAGIGFSAGIFVIYVISVRHVFAYRRLEGRSGRELAWFWGSGLIGLALTMVAVPWANLGLELPLLAAKIGVAGFVFVFNYVFRKLVLFTRWSK